VKTIPTPTAELLLTQEQLDLMKAAERAIAADERFEHLVPAEDPIREFAEHCVTDRKTNHAAVFMRRHGQEATERVCYFGVEFLSIKPPAEVAGIRFLPLDDPEIPETNPLFKLDKTIKGYAVARVTGTNDVLMAACTLSSSGSGSAPRTPLLTAAAGGGRTMISPTRSSCSRT
jgi:hypothetical protein